MKEDVERSQEDVEPRSRRAASGDCRREGASGASRQDLSFAVLRGPKGSHLHSAISLHAAFQSLGRLKPVPLSGSPGTTAVH